MAIRFAGAKSGNVPTFEPPRLKSVNQTSSAGSAAGAVSTSSIYGAFASKFDAEDIVNTGADIKSAEKMAKDDARTAIEIAGIKGGGLMDRTEIETKLIGKQAKNTDKAGDIALWSGVASGGLKLLTGGLLG